MNGDPNEKKRVAILQRVCAPYRAALFRKLCEQNDVSFRLFIGDDIEGTKVRNAKSLDGIDFVKLPTLIIWFGRRFLPRHKGLFKALKEYNPDVIVCEGESHFLGYLTACIYKIVTGRRVKLLHWCFITLPGCSDGGSGVAYYVKAFFRRMFDGFIVYSGFSRESLMRLGIPSKKIDVATNVGNVERFLNQALELEISQQEARAKLNLENRFTVSYVGTVDKVKRPEILLELGARPDGQDVNFLVVGDGPERIPLKSEAEKRGLQNVNFVGRVSDALPLYYRASDVIIVPGRGGIVFSEAMASGIPVMVHIADGTEYDLVLDGMTGIRIKDGDIGEWAQSIQELKDDPEYCLFLGQNAQRLIKNKYNTDTMMRSVRNAVLKALET